MRVFTRISVLVLVTVFTVSMNAQWASSAGNTTTSDKVGIGNHGMPNPINAQSLLLVPDPQRPIYGPEQMDFDAWLSYTWRFKFFGRDLNLRSQINVRNVFDDTGLIPVLAHTDGSILEYDMKAPRVWMISNTLRF